MITYASEPSIEGKEGARAAARKELEGRLEPAIRNILSQLSPPAGPNVELSLTYKKQQGSNGERHNYVATAEIKNVGKERIDDWQIEMQMPCEFDDRAPQHWAVASTEPGHNRYLISSERARKELKNLMPGETRQLEVPYHVDNNLYRQFRGQFPQLIIARAYVAGKEAGHDEKTIQEFSNF